MEKSSFGWKDAFRNAAAFTPESAGGVWDCTVATIHCGRSNPCA